MTRQEKYPETKTFHYYNANTHGRKSDDCVIRAIAYALHQTWEKTYMEMAELGCKHGYVQNDDWTINHYLETKGWVKCPQLRHADNTKYTVKDFVNKMNKGIYVIRMSHHLSVVDNGINIDIWDCVKYGGTVGCYYTKINN